MSMVDRVFLAIDCGVETKAAQIAQLEHAFPEGSLPGTPTPPVGWHVTLRWIGNITEVHLDRVLAELDQDDLGPPFRLRLTGLGAFPDPARAGVLWRRVDDTEGRVGALAERVEEACQNVGLPAEERSYVPHLTLSRLRPARDLEYLIHTDLRPLRMPVTAITVFRSVSAQPRPRFEVIELIELV